MKKHFHTYADVLAHPWGTLRQEEESPLTDRVLRATKLEDSIYADLRMDDTVIDEAEQASAKKLKTFPSLSRDIYQAFYTLSPRYHEEKSLSAAARKLNRHILNNVMEDDRYPAIKSICEGRELPAYEAAGEFIIQISDNLDDILKDLGGEKGAVNTLDKLERAQVKAEQELAGLLHRVQMFQGESGTLEQEILAAANRLDSKARQVEAVNKLVDTGISHNKGTIEAIISSAARSATEKVEEVQNIIGAWSNEPGNLDRNPQNIELIKKVRQSERLLDISKYLGRFREIFDQGKKNGYAYGRGEKYSLELGNKLSEAITSELSMMASPETLPLFLQKYQRRQIKQYRRREPVYKGMGDMIVCLDESGSTRGELASWGKAVAMILLEIAAENRRNFALIHFSGAGSYKTDIFRPGEYSADDKVASAETFLDGGTNFETPISEALRLMSEEDFQAADVVFITDGQCAMPQEVTDSLLIEQQQRQFTITGVLLDDESFITDFSLKPFCRNVYRTGELTIDAVAEQLIKDRISA